MADFFINYARPQRAQAAKLADWLRIQGYTVWWDFDLLPGESFGAVIRQEVETAKAIITIWSREATHSNWVMAEAQYALDKAVRLIPVRIDNTEIPVPFNVYHAPLITNWDRDELDRYRQIFVLDTPQPRDDRSDDAKEWERIKGRNDLKELEVFFRRHGRSPYGDLARERLAILKWERLRTSDDAKALAQFAQEFTETAAGDHARKRLILLRDRPLSSHVAAEGAARFEPKGFVQEMIRFLSNVVMPRRRPEIFLSYRREDSSDVAGRIFDQLALRYSKRCVFKDVDSIPLGVDFRDYVGEVLETCSVCLVVIGKNWLGSRPGVATRRIDEEKDFVRIEVEAALQNGKPIIPLFVHGSAMPKTNEFPTSIASLAFRHGLDIRADPDFHKDINRLVVGIELYRGGMRLRGRDDIRNHSGRMSPAPPSSIQR